MFYLEEIREIDTPLPSRGRNWLHHDATQRTMQEPSKNLLGSPRWVEFVVCSVSANLARHFLCSESIFRATSSLNGTCGRASRCPHLDWRPAISNRSRSLNSSLKIASSLFAYCFFLLWQFNRGGAQSALVILIENALQIWNIFGVSTKLHMIQK